MGLPTESEITGLDISYLGEPFFWVKSSPSIDTSGMDWSYLGEPFVTDYGAGGVPTTYIKFIGVSWENIGEVMGVGSDSVKKLMGVEP